MMRGRMQVESEEPACEWDQNRSRARGQTKSHAVFQHGTLHRKWALLDLSVNP
jgi:hypothetical protein